jgi:mono/diheme cytochrome c family protein
MNRAYYRVQVGALTTALFILAGCSSNSGNEQAKTDGSAPASTKEAAQVAPAKGATPAPGKEGVTTAARQEAAQIFDTRCAACHGAAGKGDGAAAAALDPKPQNYHDMAWQKSVTDEEIAKAIVHGGVSVGKSPIMVPNPDLESKPEVVQALVDKIRGFGEE